MALAQFAALPDERRRNACPAIADYMLYRSIGFQGWLAVHGREAQIEQLERAKEKGGFLFKDLQRRFEQISEKAKYCLASGAAPIDGIGRSERYADTRTEFLLRDLYRSQVPFIRRMWGDAAKREEGRSGGGDPQHGAEVPVSAMAPAPDALAEEGEYGPDPPHPLSGTWSGRSGAGDHVEIDIDENGGG